jgi:hypothetical protein
VLLRAEDHRDAVGHLSEQSSATGCKLRCVHSLLRRNPHRSKRHEQANHETDPTSDEICRAGHAVHPRVVNSARETGWLLT